MAIRFCTDSSKLSSCESYKSPKSFRKHVKFIKLLVINFLNNANVYCLVMISLRTVYLCDNFKANDPQLLLNVFVIRRDQETR